MVAVALFSGGVLALWLLVSAWRASSEYDTLMRAVRGMEQMARETVPDRGNPSGARNSEQRLLPPRVTNEGHHRHETG